MSLGLAKGSKSLVLLINFPSFNMVMFSSRNVFFFNVIKISKKFIYF